MFDMTPDSDTGTLRRPALLARAARTGAAMYCRRRDLGAALPGLAGRPAREIVARLMAAEARCEAARAHGHPGYRPAKHVQILAALTAERAALAAG